MSTGMDGGGVGRDGEREGDRRALTGGVTEGACVAWDGVEVTPHPATSAVATSKSSRRTFISDP
jgi:hypothetical protein